MHTLDSVRRLAPGSRLFDGSLTSKSINQQALMCNKFPRIQHLSLPIFELLPVAFNPAPRCNQLVSPLEETVTKWQLQFEGSQYRRAGR